MWTQIVGKTRLALAPMENVRGAGSPDEAVLEFLKASYEAAADLGRWDRAALKRAREGTR